MYTPSWPLRLDFDVKEFFKLFEKAKSVKRAENETEFKAAIEDL